MQKITQGNNVVRNLEKRENLPDKSPDEGGRPKNLPDLSNPIQFVKDLGKRVLNEVKSTNSSERLPQPASHFVPAPKKKKEPGDVPDVKSLSSTLTPYPLPPDLQGCNLVNKKDATSAISRAKTQECKDLIRNVTCLQEGGQLYDSGITNMCPKGRDPGKGFQKIPYEYGTGPPARVVFLMSIHGRAYRQVKRLFKAVYHTDHYFFIHVDSVSYMYMTNNLHSNHYYMYV